jgi:hypothetical protein
MGGHAANVDVVVLADKDTYASWDAANFQADLYTSLWNGYYGNEFVLTHQNQMSIWIGHDMADIDMGSPCTGPFAPERWDQYSFADTGWIVHSDQFRDCADPSIRIFGAWTGDATIAVHETSHSPVGLTDEYCCDAPYWQAETNPNVYAGQAACGADAPSVGRTVANCRNIKDDWWTSDPMPDVMADDQSTFNALDRRRWDALLQTCTTTKEGC